MAENGHDKTDEDRIAELDANVREIRSRLIPTQLTREEREARRRRAWKASASRWSAQSREQTDVLEQVAGIIESGECDHRELAQSIRHIVAIARQPMAVRG